MPRRIVVIGGGPIGIAAAISAIDRGFDVTLLEKEKVGTSLRSWGSTRFFSPLSMNVSPGMLNLLGGDAPPLDALLTGSEMAAQVLEPLASREPLRGRIRTNTRVVAIGRRGLTRCDYAGHPLRAERPFRLVVENGSGEEAIEADFVLDATGGYVVPNPIGTGGLPAQARSAPRGRGCSSSSRRPRTSRKKATVGSALSVRVPTHASLMIRMG